MLVALAPCRDQFYRKSPLLADRFSPQWTVAVLLVMVCTIALAVFAYKRQEYRHDLWWEFELQANAPRTIQLGRGSASKPLGEKERARSKKGRSKGSSLFYCEGPRGGGGNALRGEGFDRHTESEGEFSQSSYRPCSAQSA